MTDIRKETVSKQSLVSTVRSAWYPSWLRTLVNRDFLTTRISFLLDGERATIKDVEEGLKNGMPVPSKFPPTVRVVPETVGV